MKLLTLGIRWQKQRYLPRLRERSLWQPPVGPSVPRQCVWRLLRCEVLMWLGAPLISAAADAPALIVSGRPWWRDYSEITSEARWRTRDLSRAGSGELIGVWAEWRGCWSYGSLFALGSNSTSPMLFFSHFCHLPSVLEMFSKLAGYLCAFFLLILSQLKRMLVEGESISFRLACCDGIMTLKCVGFSYFATLSFAISAAIWSSDLVDFNLDPNHSPYSHQSQSSFCSKMKGFFLYLFLS